MKEHPRGVGMGVSDLMLARASQAAYEGKDAVQKRLNAERVFEIWDVRTDTQAYIAYVKKEVVVVFRGTEGKLDDIITDLKAWKTCRGRYRLHQGFVTAYMSIHREVAKLLKHCVDKQVYVTGHSLGGALAQICVLFNPQPKTKLVVFGSPKIGDRTVANAVSAVGGSFYVNHADIVPRLPRINYWQPETVKYFNAEDRVIENPSYWEMFTDRLLTVSERISDHSIERYIELVEKASV